MEVSSVRCKPRHSAIWRTDICGIAVAEIKPGQGRAPIEEDEKVFCTGTDGAILTKLEAIV